MSKQRKTSILHRFPYLFGLGVGLAVLLSSASPAWAWDYNQAWDATYLANIQECHNRGAIFYYCAHANFNPPACYYTGINKTGSAQWACLSAFVQGPYYPGAPYIGSPRLCRERDTWGPEGGHISQQVSCYAIGGIGSVHRPRGFLGVSH